MNKMFQVKDVTYDLRYSNILCQPKFNEITYGKNTFSYYILLWNTHLELITQQYESNAQVLTILKQCLKAWEGPKCQHV